MMDRRVGFAVAVLLPAAVLCTGVAHAAFEIDFMRHGETTWNRARLLQGTIPYPRLTAKGVAVTRATAEGLAAAGVRYDRIFASPLRRTRETADIVAAKTGPKPELRPILHERCFGTAQGKRIGENQTLQSVLDAATGVETGEEVAARVKAFLEEMKTLDGTVDRVLAVTHSHVLKGLDLALRGEGFDNSTHLPNNSINTVRYENGRFTLVSTGRIYYDAARFDSVGWVEPQVPEGEGHVFPVIGRILENVRKIQTADPAAVPMAFWDYDGTIIRGDSGLGLVVDGKECYRSLIGETIRAGFVPMYAGADGYRTWLNDYTRLSELGVWLSHEYDAQMYRGVLTEELDAFCERSIREQDLAGWYFASSMTIWKALADAGVENYVVSANIEAIVRNAAPTLGIPRGRIRASRVEELGGRWTTRLLTPIPYGEGKTDVVRDLVNLRPHGVAVAAFGNSYPTDGAFLRFVATQPSLPGGAVGTAVMINGGAPEAGFGEHFIRVEQHATANGLLDRFSR